MEIGRQRLNLLPVVSKHKNCKNAHVTQGRGQLTWHCFTRSSSCFEGKAEKVSAVDSLLTNPKRCLKRRDVSGRI